MDDKELRDLVLNTVCDLARSFTYDDRQEDEELSAESLEDAIGRSVVTVDEIVGKFRDELVAQLLTDNDSEK